MSVAAQSKRLSVTGGLRGARAEGSAASEAA